MKRWMKGMLVLGLVLVVIPATLMMSAKAEEVQSLSAETAIDSGYCGRNAIWTLYSDGLMVISGTGSVAEVDKSQWNEHAPEIMQIVVEEGITSIGEGVFDGWKQLRKVTLAETVKEIGAEAFIRCTGLKEVSLPETLEKIGEFAFAGVGFEEIFIPEKVCCIEDNAFFGCPGLTAIRVDENNSVYCSDSYGVLYNRDKTRILMAPTFISGDYVLPEGVAKIDEFAFIKAEENMDLEKWRNGLYLGTADNPYYAFIRAEYIALGAFELHEQTRMIASRAFANASMYAVTIPENVFAIGDMAFEYCENLISIALPQGVTSIGKGAFAYCTILEHINLGSVERIEMGAFADCSGLTQITIPASVTYVGVDAFRSCSNLKMMTFQGSAPVFESESLPYTDMILRYPAEDATWSELNRESLGGDISWQPYSDLDDMTLVASGSCGDHASWYLDTQGVLVVSGSGAISSGSNVESYWKEFGSHVREVIVEEGITTIPCFD